MLDIPETRYARSGGAAIAHQVFGDGPIDVVFAPGFVSNIEVGWSIPARAEFLRALTEFARVIQFDKRGTGISDPLRDELTLEVPMDDVRAVMDAAGSERAALLGIDSGGMMSVIHVPTLVAHRHGDRVVDIRAGRYLADRIAGARFLELAGADHSPFAGGGADELVGVARGFLSEVQAEGPWAEHDRILVTVLFTDIVGSTATAAELGDARWRELLEHHNAAIRRQLARHRGTEVETAGDGFLASFDGPARAIRCATAIIESVRGLGLEVRAGVHTGECELVEGKVTGIAVHIGARVAEEAHPSEVLVSSTVKDLVAGSELEFEDHGNAELRGVPGEWRLYAVRA
jgi:class 3 adenylate cyclase